jgi:transposase-like protein
MATRYHASGTGNAKVVGEIVDVLDQLAREGARLMLERALGAEVDEFLGRERYARGGEFRGYRNGYGRSRSVAIGTWAVPVRAPRVSDVPDDSPAFASMILPKRKRLSLETQKLFCRLYLEGLSTGDFEPVFRQLLGETAPLSPNTIVRLKEEWEQEYEAWRHRSLEQERFVYAWADGIYLGAGLEKQNSCLLTIVGARADGTKELLAMDIGYRESKASWADVLRDLRGRGLRAPLLLIGDGNLGVWGGLSEVFPSTRRQRCWNHRLLNLKDKLPRRLHADVSPKLYELYQAPTRQHCEALRDELAAWLRAEGQMAAADTLYRDWEDFVTFYDFPQEHWLHLRTTNPLESVFAGVRLRTDVAKRARKRENALYLVYKIVTRLGHNWRGLNGGPRLMQMVAAGAVFNDGVLVEPDQHMEVKIA